FSKAELFKMNCAISVDTYISEHNFPAARRGKTWMRRVVSRGFYLRAGRAGGTPICRHFFFFSSQSSSARLRLTAAAAARRSSWVAVSPPRVRVKQSGSFKENFPGDSAPRSVDHKLADHSGILRRIPATVDVRTGERVRAALKSLGHEGWARLRRNRDVGLA